MQSISLVYQGLGLRIEEVHAVSRRDIHTTARLQASQLRAVGIEVR